MPGLQPVPKSMFALDAPPTSSASPDTDQQNLLSQSETRAHKRQADTLTVATLGHHDWKDASAAHPAGQSQTLVQLSLEQPSSGCSVCISAGVK